MNALLKIVCCALTTVAVMGVVKQSTVALHPVSSHPGSNTWVAAFVPEPTAPPVITQGSGTR
jgi:hypothetical protein